MIDSSIPTLRIGSQKGGKTGIPLTDKLATAQFVIRPGTLSEAFPDRMFPPEYTNRTAEDILVCDLPADLGSSGFRIILEQRKNSDLIRELPNLNGIICGEDYLAEHMLMPVIEGVDQKPSVALAGWLGIGNCSLNLLVPKEIMTPELENVSEQNLQKLFRTAGRIATKYPEIVKAKIRSMQNGDWSALDVEKIIENVSYNSGGVERQVRSATERAVDIVETGRSATAAFLDFRYILGSSTTVVVANNDNLTREQAALMQRLVTILQPNPAANRPAHDSLLGYWRPLDQLPRLAA